jgi:hypothetical protein
VTAPARACPSSSIEHATQLLGVLGPDGRIHFVSPALTIDDGFRAKAAQAGSPERRFRLTGDCVQGACGQWTGTRCGVIDSVVAETAAAGVSDAPRSCPIRGRCQWFAQSGAAACRVCPLVVTDTRRPAPTVLGTA